MICELVVKCITLITVIHGLRGLSRRLGPRACGMLLGLPSSTAILLVLCGRERGAAGAIAMADASLLGLVAAVSLPIAYARAVRQGWGLAAALAAAIAAYVGIASGLGCLAPDDSRLRMVVSFGSIVTASYLASRVGMPAEASGRSSPSDRWIAALRTLVPLVYVAIVGLVSGFAGPSWTGLVSTFPSMSTVVVAATHLEAGAAEASRIARALPPANLSTAAFLAAFRFVSPALGLGWGTLCGYAAALVNLAAIELIPRSIRAGARWPRYSLGWRWDAADRPWARPSRFLRLLFHDTGQRPPRSLGRVRAPHRRPFSPLVEILPC
jgi:hypothetical protein